MTNKVYKNSSPLMNLHGVPVYMDDMVDACLYGRLNLFLQGDTGSGKTQLARDAMSYFGDKSMFILGRNDMDTRELFQRVNLEALRSGKSSDEIKELTEKIGHHLIVVDELPNCVPAVRAQLFNLFDGFIEINGKAYPIGQGYSVGIATGNIGQQFTESSNDLGRALKDRMHVIVDVDHFFPKARDTLEVLYGNTNPRVEFTSDSSTNFKDVIDKYKEVVSTEIPLEKLIVANYLLHGLDHCSKGSKRKMKDSWPNALEDHEQGSDVGLVLPVSPRASKSIVRLSQSLDNIVKDKGASQEDIDAGYLDSMMQAYKFVSAHSGVLNDSAVRNNYHGDNYSALDAVISTTQTQFNSQADNIASGLEMVAKGKSDQRILNSFSGRWEFMKDILEYLVEQNKPKQED